LIARNLQGAEVPGSNPGTPTNTHLPDYFLLALFLVRIERP